MKKILLRLGMNMAAWYAAVQLIGEPQVRIDSWKGYVWVVIIMGFVNTFIKPVLKLLTFPVNLLTLGLFTFILNAFLLQMVDLFSPPLHIQNFWVALKTSIALGVVGMVLNSIFK